jgi:hypothetical protein
VPGHPGALKEFAKLTLFLLQTRSVSARYSSKAWLLLDDGCITRAFDGRMPFVGLLQPPKPNPQHPILLLRIQSPSGNSRPSNRP